MNVNEEKVFCVVCGGEVPHDRKKHRSITCGDACKKERTKYLHRRAERVRCRYCAQPVTPEEMARFKAWRKYEAIITGKNQEIADDLRAYIDRLYVRIPKRIDTDQPSA